MSDYKDKQNLKSVRVVKVILKWNDKILVEKRAQGEQKHSLFGGKVDQGEINPVQALRREVKEEIDIDLNPTKIIFLQTIKTLDEWEGELKMYTISFFEYQLSQQERESLKIKRPHEVAEIIEVDKSNYIDLIYIPRYGNFLHTYMTNQ